MTYIINQKLNSRVAYPTIPESYSIRLEANENPVDPHVRYAAEIAEALRTVAFNRYPDDSCSELRTAFADLHGLPPESVVAGNGSDEMISLLIGGALSGQEALLVVEPDFSMYRLYAEAHEKVLWRFPRPAGQALDVDALIREILQRRPSMVLLSNPASPFADVLDRQTVRRLAEAADEAGALAVIDEAYMDFCDQSVIAEAPGSTNLVVLRTLSKAWGLAGLRLGFLTTSPELAARLNAFRPPYNIGALNQAAGRVILGHPEFLRETVQTITLARDRLFEQLQAFSASPEISRIWPSVTNFIYIETAPDSRLYEALGQRSILVRRLPGAIRITVGTAAENTQLLAALNDILNGRQQPSPAQI